jgi:hypothetical protein
VWLNKPVICKIQKCHLAVESIDRFERSRMAELLRRATPIARTAPHHIALMRNADHCGGFMGAVRSMMILMVGGPSTSRPTVREGTLVHKLPTPIKTNPRIVVSSVRR